MSTTESIVTDQPKQSLPWGWIIGGAIALEVIMLASAFLWVAIYAWFINSGQPEAHYQAYAKVASPVVSLIAGIPIFFAGCWWMARRARTRPMAAVIGATLVYLLIDVVIILTLAEDQRYNWLMTLLNDPTKLLAGYFGGKWAAK